MVVLHLLHHLGQWLLLIKQAILIQWVILLLSLILTSANTLISYLCRWFRGLTFLFLLIRLLTLCALHIICCSDNRSKKLVATINTWKIESAMCSDCRKAFKSLCVTPSLLITLKSIYLLMINCKNIIEPKYICQIEGIL